MPFVNRLLATLWIVFVVYWIVQALRAKRSLGRSLSWRAVAVRSVIAAGAVGLWAMRRRLPGLGGAAAHDPTLAYIGLFVVGLGLGFAVWARVHIGRDWGPPMTQRVEPELVSSGPYAFVRHPIYSGILLAMFGSALAQGPAWLVVFAVFGVYFVASARAEERLMARLFPDAYPDYRKRTAMLVPHVY